MQDQKKKSKKALNKKKRGGEESSSFTPGPWDWKWMISESAGYTEIHVYQVSKDSDSSDSSATTTTKEQNLFKVCSFTKEEEEEESKSSSPADGKYKKQKKDMDQVAKESLELGQLINNVRLLVEAPTMYKLLQQANDIFNDLKHLQGEHPENVSMEAVKELNKKYADFATALIFLQGRVEAGDYTSSADTQLSPCPFCGAKAKLSSCSSKINSSAENEEEDYYAKTSFIAACLNPVCFVRPRTIEFDTINAAVKAWNRREES